MMVPIISGITLEKYIVPHARSDPPLTMRKGSGGPDFRFYICIQIHSRSDHADSLDDDAVCQIRAVPEEEGCREDRDTPEDNNDE